MWYGKAKRQEDTLVARAQNSVLQQGGGNWTEHCSMTALDAPPRGSVDTAPGNTPTPHPRHQASRVPAAVSAHCTQQRHKQGKHWQNKEAFRRWQIANSNRIIPVQASSRYKHTVPSFSNKTQPWTPGSFLHWHSKPKSASKPQTKDLFFWP